MLTLLYVRGFWDGQRCLRRALALVKLVDTEADDVGKQVDGVILALHILDLGQNVDHEPVSLAPLPVAAVHVVTAGEQHGEHVLHGLAGEEVIAAGADVVQPVQ